MFDQIKKILRDLYIAGLRGEPNTDLKVFVGQRKDEIELLLGSMKAE